LHSVEAAIGIAVLEPQTLRRQQRLMLRRVDSGLQRLVGCIQPLISRVGLCLYALDNASVELIAARLDAPPEHLGCSRERRHPGEHRDCEKHPSDDIISIPFVCSNEHVARPQCTAANLETEMPEEPRRRTLTIRRASSRRYAPR
jgi:hypothetical protein